MFLLIIFVCFGMMATVIFQMHERVALMQMHAQAYERAVRNELLRHSLMLVVRHVVTQESFVVQSARGSEYGMQLSHMVPQVTLFFEARDAQGVIVVAYRQGSSKKTLLARLRVRPDRSYGVELL